MTPKEKAQELIKSMYGYTFDGGEFEDAEDGWYRATQCARIAAENILKELAYTQNYVNDEMNRIKIYISYWQEVKQEIELL